MLPCFLSPKFQQFSELHKWWLLLLLLRLLLQLLLLLLLLLPLLMRPLRRSPIEIPLTISHRRWKPLMLDGRLPVPLPWTE